MAGGSITNGCDIIAGKVTSFCSQNKAHIYTGLSVAGTITTGVLAARCGARMARRIDRREEELNRRLTKKEKFDLCWKDCVVPVAAGAVSIFGAVGSDIVNTRTIGETTALLITTEKAYRNLSEKTKRVLGEKKAQQIQDEINKEKIEEAKQNGTLAPLSMDNAPRSGNGALFPYIDGYSGLLFWSNPDYINCCMMSMQKTMKEIRGRNDEYDYNDKMIGVPYSEWLKNLNFDKSVWNSRERRYHGWNKGYCKDGRDDDVISYTTTTQEYKPGFAVTVIDWETDPTDMRLGRMLKVNGL